MIQKQKTTEEPEYYKIATNKLKNKRKRQKYKERTDKEFRSIKIKK